MKSDRTTYPPPRALGWALRRLRPRSAVILAYHGVADTPLSADPEHLMISDRALHAQVRALKEAGFGFVTVSELAARADPAAEREKLAALTFDDGLLNLLEPLTGLAESGVPASVFQVVAWIGGQHPRLPGSSDTRMLDRAHLRALVEAGIEVGSHSMTHPDLSTLSYSACLAELRESRQALEEIIARPVRSLAYPFGHHNELVRKAARESGYEIALATEDGGYGTFALQRVPIWRLNGWTAFGVKVAGLWPSSNSIPGRIGRAAAGLRPSG